MNQADKTEKRNQVDKLELYSKIQEEMNQEDILELYSKTDFDARKRETEKSKPLRPDFFANPDNEFDIEKFKKNDTQTYLYTASVYKEEKKEEETIVYSERELEFEKKVVEMWNNEQSNKITKLFPKTIPKSTLSNYSVLIQQKHSLLSRIIVFGDGVYSIDCYVGGTKVGTCVVLNGQDSPRVEWELPLGGIIMNCDFHIISFKISCKNVENVFVEYLQFNEDDHKKVFNCTSSTNDIFRYMAGMMGVSKHCIYYELAK